MLRKNDNFCGLTKSLAVVNLFIFLSCQSALAQSKCESIFYTLKDAALDSFVSQLVSKNSSSIYFKAASAELNSTTGNRVERKFTSTAAKINENLLQLENSLKEMDPNFNLQARDKQTAGFNNITFTKYLTKLSLTLGKEELVTKIRLRKYGLIATEKAQEVSNFIPIKSMFDSQQQPVSWLEFKIQHPEHENAVLKPRILVYDKHMDLLGSPKEFLAQIDTIKADTKKLNREDIKGSVTDKDQLVEDMFAALAKTLSEKIPLKQISQTMYKRTSFAVNLKDTVTNEPVNIQITLDNDIHQYSNALNRSVESYDPALGLAVLEIKVPVKYAKFTESDLSAVSGLDKIVALIKRMLEVQQTGYSVDKGKFSRAVDTIMELDI